MSEFMYRLQTHDGIVEVDGNLILRDTTGCVAFENEGKIEVWGLEEPDKCPTTKDYGCCILLGKLPLGTSVQFINSAAAFYHAGYATGKDVGGHQASKLIREAVMAVVNHLP